MSNGAMMTYRLACESALPIAAIAPVAGTLTVPCEHPQRVSVLHVHGLADGNVPIGGGVGVGFARVPYRPVADGIAVFRKADDCAAPVTTTAGPVTTARSACANGKIVELTTVAGAGHQWPGAVPPPARAAALLRLEAPSAALDATEVIWSFFAAARHSVATRSGPEVGVRRIIVHVEPHVANLAVRQREDQHLIGFDRLAVALSGGGAAHEHLIARCRERRRHDFERALRLLT
jgi:hypothetical protein